MSETPESPVKQGDVVAGRYVVERVIAVGGMGTVVAARHLQLGHKVALKFLHTSGPVAKDAAPRFLGEAKAAARLKGEHVVHVSDMGTLESGVPYMVMEFLDGVDLGDALEHEGPMPMPVAIDYILQACEGLAEAHAARIVHRDLKPQNLFRTHSPDGTPLVKVVDFGVSKALSDDVRVVGTVTSTDAVFGSPLYMSPEQMVSSTRADQRSDVWSIGVVLYELLTQRLPFESETMTGLCVQIANSPPRKLLEDAPQLPPELEAVIERCLEKDPGQRYQNVAELAADLSPFAPPQAQVHVESIRRLVGSGLPASLPSLSRVTGASPSGRRLPRLDGETLGPMTGAGFFRPARRKRRWVVAGAALAVVVAAAAVGGWLVRGTGGGRAPAASHAPSVASAPVAAPPGSSPGVRVSRLPPVASSVATPPAASSATPKPRYTAGTVRTAKPPPSAPPTVSTITGISLDRK